MKIYTVTYIKRVFCLSIMLMCMMSTYVFAVVGPHLSLEASKQTLGIGEQFYVDIMLGPQTVSVNGIEGTIVYEHDNLSFVRAEEGKSIINGWIEKPHEREDGALSFSGIIPNGFTGVIDPFNNTHLLSGLVVRLVFEAKKSGQTVMTPQSFLVTANDGLGTPISVTLVPLSFSIVSMRNDTTYAPDSSTSPSLRAYVVSDPNLYNDQYVLIYEATDSGSGIKDVRIKEGSREWESIESPYVLRDQTRHSRIEIEAINFAGAKTSVYIERLPSPVFSVYTVSILLLCLLCVGIFLKKYVKTKKNSSV